MEKAVGMTTEQAREEIRKNMEEEIKKELAPRIMNMEQEMKNSAEQRARMALSQTLARLAGEVSTERTTASLPIKGEETKGKIIGREGRNIRALESALWSGYYY